MTNLKELFELGLKFHGHRCPAMPMGLRAGLEAMKKLGVERSQDKELYLIAETGKGHAAGCFLDGLMTATGCTYGKSNIEKKYWNKMAFTLIDQVKARSVRVSLKSDFFKQAVNSPFVQKRKEGVLPQDISEELVNPMIENILNLESNKFLDFSEIKTVNITKKKGVFEIANCEDCKEAVFVNKLVDTKGKKVCMSCASNYSN